MCLWYYLPALILEERRGEERRREEKEEDKREGGKGRERNSGEVRDGADREARERKRERERERERRQGYVQLYFPQNIAKLWSFFPPKVDF